MALKYVKRGYHVLCAHFLTLLLVPVAATVVVHAPAVLGATAGGPIAHVHLPELRALGW